MGVDSSALTNCLDAPAAAASSARFSVPGADYPGFNGVSRIYSLLNKRIEEKARKGRSIFIVNDRSFNYIVAQDARIVQFQPLH